MRTILTTLVAALALAVPAQQAAAQGVATNGRTLDLRFPPQAGDATCVSRSIELAFGKYRWQLGHRFAGGAAVWPSSHDRYPVPWRTYTWRDCIVNNGSGYKHTSYLEWREDDGTIKSWAAPSYVISHGATPRISTWFGSTLQRIPL
jgi:hypothetical protein